MWHNDCNITTITVQYRMARNMFVKGPWRQVETLILCFYCQTKTVSTTIWHSIFKFHQVRCHLVVVWHNQFIAALSDGISSLTFQSNAKFSKGQFLAPESWDVKKKIFCSMWHWFTRWSLFGHHECHLFSLILPHITGYRPILPESWV